MLAGSEGQNNQCFEPREDGQARVGGVGSHDEAGCNFLEGGLGPS
jgi:hypothetical protein